MNKILEVKNLNYFIDEKKLFFKNEPIRILKNISFEMTRGEMLGIAGESGSGKTTLAKVIAGIIIPSEGNMSIFKKNEWGKIRTSPVQILFQNNSEILNPFRKISEVVKETLIIRNGSRKNLDDEIRKIFLSVNFPDNLQEKKGFQLSGGEQQRAALARILAAKPELLILDEPFSAQDSESQFNLVELFKNINTKLGISMICIAHNLSLLRELCDKILIMYKGEIVEQGLCKEIFAAPKHPYTRFLLRAENYDLSYEELKYSHKDLHD